MHLPQPSRRIPTDDGATLAVAVAGPRDEPDRPLAVLQHGFPDTPSTWRQLAPRLVEDGYRVAMPWLRGYHPSSGGDRRPSTFAYADDLRAVHEALGGDHRAVLVGHDWGALAAWRAAVDVDRWAAVVGIAVPPEPALRGHLLDLDQLWRSRYQLQAQLPVSGWVADERLRPLVDIWLRWSPGYTPVAADLVALRDALRGRPQVRAAVAPYRAHARDALLGRYPAADGPVPTQPALLVHGRDDRCFDVRYAIGARPLLAGGHRSSTVWLVEDAGHWVHLEQPELVVDAISTWLQRVTVGAAA